MRGRDLRGYIAGLAGQARARPTEVEVALVESARPAPRLPTPLTLVSTGDGLALTVVSPPVSIETAEPPTDVVSAAEVVSEPMASAVIAPPAELDAPPAELVVAPPAEFVDASPADLVEAPHWELVDDPLEELIDAPLEDVADAPPAELVEPQTAEPFEPAAAELLEAPPAEPVTSSRPLKTRRPKREAVMDAPPASDSPGEVEIEFREVSVNFGKIEALRKVTFTIRAGELVFLIGASGAGKTTTFRLINGQMRPTKGQVWVDDTAVHKARRRHLASLRRRIGFMGEDCGLIDNRTALENIEFALRVSDLSLPLSEARTRALAALRNVGLFKRAGALPPQLSTGQRQRIAIARALVTRPSILLADEPTAGVDGRNAMKVVKLLQRAASHQTAVLVATHDGAMAASVRARVLTLEGGKLVGDFPSWTELCRTE